jgi:Fe2+ transport system protein B
MTSQKRKRSKLAAENMGRKHTRINRDQKIITETEKLMRLRYFPQRQIEENVIQQQRQAEERRQKIEVAKQKQRAEELKVKMSIESISVDKVSRYTLFLLLVYFVFSITAYLSAPLTLLLLLSHYFSFSFTFFPYSYKKNKTY